MKGCPKWLPDELHTFVRLDLQERGPDDELIWRLCTDERMREVWEWYSKETLARTPQPQPRSAIPVSSFRHENWFQDAEHFLMLMRIPKTQLGKFTSTAPGQRREKLSAVRKHAKALQNLIEGSEIAEKSSGKLEISIPNESTAAQVVHDLAEQRSTASKLGIPMTLSYSISPDGSTTRLDGDFPFSSLPNLLERVAYWAENFEELAEGSLLENVGEIRQSGDRARKKSYFFSLYRLIQPVGAELPLPHYAAIVNTALDLAESEEADERKLLSYLENSGKQENRD